MKRLLHAFVASCASAWLEFMVCMGFMAGLAISPAVCAAVQVGDPIRGFSRMGTLEAPGAAEALARIEMLQRQARDESLDARRRIEAVEAVLQARRGLIEQFPSDPRAAIWLGDQAADALFDLLPIEASGLTALFGLPSARQRELAARVAALVNQAARDADARAAETIAAIERDPDFTRSESLQSLRTQLQVQREERLTFLRGVGAFLHAELAPPRARSNAHEVAGRDDADRAAQLAASARLLGAVADDLAPPAASTARLYQGLALMRQGEFDAAEPMLDAVARDPAAAPADVFAARMGVALNRAARGGPQAGLAALDALERRYEAPDALLFRLLITDQRFLLRSSLARHADDPAARADLLAQAFGAYTALLDRAPPSIPRLSLRAIVLSRLARAADRDDVPLDALPPLVRIARADRLASDPATRPAAIGMLEALLHPPQGAAPLEASDRAAALFILGRALLDAGQPMLACTRFLELAQSHPTDPNAERAVELGVSIAADLRRREPSDSQAREALAFGLDLMLQRYPNVPTIDRWRFEAGRLALDEGGWDKAAGLFAQVTPAAAEHLDALFMQASAARAALNAAEAGEPRSQRARALLGAIERIRPALEAGASRAAEPRRAADLLYYVQALTVFQAQGLVELGQPQQALETLAGLDQQQPLDAAVLGEALALRIAAYQALRQPELALEDVERLLIASPGQAPAAIAPMLQALQREVEARLNISRDEEARALALRTLLPIAQQVQRTLLADRDLGAPDLPLALRVADAYRLSGEPAQALPLYERLLRIEPAALELLAGRAECLFALGNEQRLADAMALYKRIAAATTPRDAAHWLAQLRMLQILDRVDRHAQQIVPRIDRLRQQDRELGGERFRRQFETLRAKHAARTQVDPGSPPARP